jgi:hypothetical protein
MKTRVLIFTFIVIGLFSCQSDKKEQEATTQEEKTEMQQVETMQKSDKEKEDSVKAYWEEKMKKSKVKDEE